jgi:hypothetical protein
MNKKYASRALAAFIVLAVAAWLLPTFRPGEVVVTLQLDGIAGNLDDLGHPISASGTLNNEIDGGSNITYQDWSTHCARTEPADMMRCNAPAPTADDVLAVQADARRVRSWFNPAVTAKPR